MKTFWIIVLTLGITHTTMGVVNVVVSVPAQPNTFFPNNTISNNTNDGSKIDVPTHADTPTPSPEPTPLPSVKAAHSKDYFLSLFDEVEIAKKTPPTISSVKLHDKLAEDSVALGILKEYPYLSVGPMTFRPLIRKAVHRTEIQRGQKLLIDNFGGKNLNYKELTELIDLKISDPNIPISDKDWILISNASQTLKAPGNSNKAHLLGNFIAEYILLAEIKKQESKQTLAPSDDSLLSTLYYDLAQLYQIMYKNDENIFKKDKSGILALPIDPIYRGDLTGEYRNEYPVPLSDLVGRRLDLLENAILFDPDDDLPWAQLIDFTAFDLPDPEFYEQFSDEFWEDYFPLGFRRHHAEELRHKWRQIHHHPDIRSNPNIRVNSAAGSRTLRRLTNVHALPTSLLNRTIGRKAVGPQARAVARTGTFVAGTHKTPSSSLASLNKASKRAPLSANSTRFKGSKHSDTSYSLHNALSPNRVHEPNLSRYNAPRHTALPHHATTTRASSFGNVVRGSVPNNPHISKHESFGGQSFATHSRGGEASHGSISRVPTFSAAPSQKKKP